MRLVHLAFVLAATSATLSIAQPPPPAPPPERPDPAPGLGKLPPVAAPSTDTTNIKPLEKGPDGGGRRFWPKFGEPLDVDQVSDGKADIVLTLGGHDDQPTITMQLLNGAKLGAANTPQLGPCLASLAKSGETQFSGLLYRKVITTSLDWTLTAGFDRNFCFRSSKGAVFVLRLSDPKQSWKPPKLTVVGYYWK